MPSACFTFPLLFLLFVFPFSSSSDDGQSLLSFKKLITSDPNHSMASWNPALPFCHWNAVSCSRRHPTRVVALHLNGMDLRGTISPSTRVPSNICVIFIWERIVSQAKGRVQFHDCREMGRGAGYLCSACHECQWFGSLRAFAAISNKNIFYQILNKSIFTWI